MFNLTSSAPKSWQTVSRQADRVNAEQTYNTYQSEPIPTIQELGVVLRDRREAMGASLAEVETATRIRQKYLSALESDDWHLLPGEVVGRGFLRNYATYLGLDQTELVERRRAVADPAMTSTLAGTSAASPLPPERNVDYRPKDVALKDEPEGIQQREIRTGPIFRVIGLFGGLFLIWWIWSSFGVQISNSIATTRGGVQTLIAASPSVIATTNPDSNGNSESTAPLANDALTEPQPSAQESRAPENSEQNNLIAPAAPTVTPTSNQPVIVEPVATATAAPQRLLIPTDIPADIPASAEAANTIEAPTAEPVGAAAVPDSTDDSATPLPTVTPLPAPTNTPIPVPTETPEPAPTEVPAAAVVIAPACPDPRSTFSSPGINQTITGAVAITGSATHEAFQYYKLEYAFGADATDGFVYFDGAESAVEGGTLGIFNTPSLPNGAYTLQLTVVDLSANYPPPCRVSVTIAN